MERAGIEALKTVATLSEMMEYARIKSEEAAVELSESIKGIEDPREIARKVNNSYRDIQANYVLVGILHQIVDFGDSMDWQDLYRRCMQYLKD